MSAQNEEAMRLVRKLLGAAHQAYIGENDTEWAAALNATAINLLAGVVHRERKVVD